MKVFDASAALAVVFAESGADKAEQLIESGEAVISSVNHAEVVARLLERGMSEAEVDAICEGLRLRVLPFTEAQALASGRLRLATKSLGLSLGDRCCLALAQQHRGAQVVTADRPWKGLKGFKVTLIR
jgi:PIN domain nuclease of toxin-antitoxin system